MGGDDVISGTVLSSSFRSTEGSTVVDRELREGEVLGSYQLERLLGEGSMGQVFQARHVRLGRQVALKVLRPAFAHDNGFVRRFFQEAHAVNRINHEHIVEIFDFVEDAQHGHVYCVMELLRGQNLSSLVKEEQLSVMRIRRITVQVCAALGAAHQLGVVHRDVKPDNLFITHKGGQADFVKVLDFGVAKLLTAENTSGTLDGTIIGTPTYMSPEQAAGLPVDHRADIYAVGAVLYEMLSGQPPYLASNFGQLMVKIITAPPPALPSHTPSGEPVPQSLAQLTLRCLAKEPADRPQSLAEVITVLLADTVPEPIPEDRRPTQPLPVPGWLSGARRRGMAIAAGVLAVSLAGLALWPRAEHASSPDTVEASTPVALPSSSEHEARLDSPAALEELPALEEPRAPRDAARGPVRTNVHRKQKAGMRDDVIDPFAH
ncbi:serine/threonine protein kinase [Archangium violaceum]|uniref:serine/threonine protein kinase n=1 Tax=Archangium violaceum TaxID=83451 RepID=UPI0019502A3E|nr:serine/threonine-protein kinase [Archangium violaceum]QRN96107.1 serine/threonine protein kinase [Archangium violaceum]